MLHNGRFFGSFVSFLYCLSSKTGKFFLKKWKIIQPCSIWWEYMVCPDRIRNSSRLCRLQWSIRMFEPGKIDPLRVANQSCIPHDWRWASSASCRPPYRLESKRVKFVMQPSFLQKIKEETNQKLFLLERICIIFHFPLSDILMVWLELY